MSLLVKDGKLVLRDGKIMLAGNSSCCCNPPPQTGACCQRTFIPCVPGDCVATDHYWAFPASPGLPPIQWPCDPAHSYTDGCLVRTGSCSSGSVLGYATEELAIWNGSTVVNGSCAGPMTQSECDAILGQWIPGKTCSEAPCPGDCYGSGYPSPCESSPLAYTSCAETPLYSPLYNFPNCSPEITSATVTIQGVALQDPTGNADYQPLADAVNSTFILHRNTTGPGFCALDGVTVPVVVNDPYYGPRACDWLVAISLFQDYPQPLVVILNIRSPCDNVAGGGAAYPGDPSFLADCSCVKYYTCQGTATFDLSTDLPTMFDFSNATASVTIA
jgi:hypothetical protein